MRSKLDKLSTTLGSVLKAQGLGSRLSEYRVLGQWEKIAGPAIARHAQPQAVRGKKLTLVVDSPAWMQQLSLLKPELLEKINKTLGKEVVTDIALRLGDVARQDRPEEERQKDIPLDSAELEKIAEYTRTIGDADTREAVRRVIEKDFLTRKNKRKPS